MAADAHSFGDFDIRPASNEAEALYLLEGFKPDITVIDIAASHLDGTQILQRIRQRDIDARILIVTTMQPESIAEYINQSQHTDYLCKANPIPEIRSEIQRHIETLVPSYRL
ncbi:response regulator [Candidatus Reidiella endopervernicosa]|uniref:Response regulator n=1 Tax=Candidatus Reidiella endopervernicosa TaxID=2738883 RepID=A0A6N0I108_9GAMM|nr:response regulator [Candidatus Reidiella endopervernicosa]